MNDTTKTATIDSHVMRAKGFIIDLRVDQKRSAILVPHTNPVRVRGSVARSAATVTALVVLILVAFAGLSSVGSTMSYFSDTEKSTANLLQADPLAFTLDLSGAQQVDISHQEFRTVTLVPDVLSEPIQYWLSVSTSTGDADLCNALNVRSTSTLPYDGKLLPLFTETTTDLTPITFAFSLDDASLYDNRSCFVDLLYVGKNADAAVGQGYSDAHKMSLQFFVPKNVLTPLAESAILVDILRDEPMQSNATSSEASSSDMATSTMMVDLLLSTASTTEATASSTPVMSDATRTTEDVVASTSAEIGS